MSEANSLASTDTTRTFDEEMTMDWDGNAEDERHTERDGESRKRARKRVRKRRQKRPPGEREAQNQPDDAPERGVDYVEFGSGDFCTMTAPRDGGPVVIHRFETKEEAEQQHRKNVEADAPLAGVDGSELN